MSAALGLSDQDTAVERENINFIGQESVHRTRLTVFGVITAAVAIGHHHGHAIVEASGYLLGVYQRNPFSTPGTADGNERGVDDRLEVCHELTSHC